jgi:hypothetical protein
MAVNLILAAVGPAVALAGTLQLQDPCGEPKIVEQDLTSKDGLASYVHFGAGVGGVLIPDEPDPFTATVRLAETAFWDPVFRLGLTQVLRVAPDRELLLGGRVALVLGSFLELSPEAHYGWHLGGDALPNEDQFYLGGAVGLDLMALATLTSRVYVPLEVGGTTLEFGMSVRPDFLYRLLGGSRSLTPQTQTVYILQDTTFQVVGMLQARLLSIAAAVPEDKVQTVYGFVCSKAESVDSARQLFEEAALEIRQVSECEACASLAERLDLVATREVYTSLRVQCAASAIERALYRDRKYQIRHQCERERDD